MSVAQRADTTDCVSGRRYASVRAESRGARRSRPRRPPLPANGRSPNGLLPSHFHIFRRTARQRAAPPVFEWGGCAPTKNGRNVHARSHGGCATERPLTRPAGRALGGDPIAPSLSSRFQSHGGNRAIAEGEEGDVASSHAPGGIWGARVHDGNQFMEEDRGRGRWCEAWASHWDTARFYQLDRAGKMEGRRPAAAGLPRRAGRPARAARARRGSGFRRASVARLATGRRPLRCAIQSGRRS